LQIAIAKRALADDPHCGDECGSWQVGSKTFLCVADGLGHGEHAEVAATAAINYVGKHISDSFSQIFAGCDRALRDTRGAVMSLAVVDEDKEMLTHAGIGNTRVVVLGAKTFKMTSSYGIVGGGYKSLRLEAVPFSPGDMAILCTDGLKDVSDISSYTEIAPGNVQDLAERILEDRGLKTDDAAVMICRWGRAV
jgi:serine/threonine protein phosphatase PrpC